ncbi:hypothetical protein ANCCAN_00451 [Ancylostoma caninum]|uniref:Uncharacterized protein n=1 Tax=Ancylostoma caninum TaxID=29170 RepID=A0A368HDG8_ANCCA|nr:hypothetical protein ANCCAN_00451 [Ancylostoma caninum]
MYVHNRVHVDGGTNSKNFFIDACCKSSAPDSRHLEGGVFTSPSVQRRRPHHSGLNHQILDDSLWWKPACVEGPGFIALVDNDLRKHLVRVYANIGDRIMVRTYSGGGSNSNLCGEYFFVLYSKLKILNKL